MALAAGELVRIGFGEVGELHEFEQFFDFGADLFFGRTFGLGQYGQTEGDVVKHVHVAEEGVVLEHETDFALAHMLGGDVLAVKEDVAVIGVFQSGDDAQERGFPCSALPAAAKPRSCASSPDWKPPTAAISCLTGKT